MKHLLKSLSALLALGVTLPAAAQNNYASPFLFDFESVTTRSAENNLGPFRTAGGTTESAPFVAGGGGGLSRVLSKSGTPSIAGAFAGQRTWTQSSSGVKFLHYQFKLTSDANALTGAYIRAIASKALTATSNGTEYDTVLPAPVVDLSGRVRFNVYTDRAFQDGANGTPLTPQVGNFDIRVALGIFPATNASINDLNALGKFGGGAYDTVFFVGQGVTETGAPGGILVQALETPLAPDNNLRSSQAPQAPFQEVVFDLGTDPRRLFAGSRDYLASPLGNLGEVIFTIVSPSANQVFNIYIDDIVIERGPSVRGTLILPSNAAPTSDVVFTFVPKDGTPRFNRTVPASQFGANGDFTVRSVPRRDYDVYLKTPNTLRVKVGANAIEGDVTGLQITPRSGDVNDDNFVDIADLLVLIAAYNKVSPAEGFSVAADLNADNINDITDLLLLIGSYNAPGEFLP